MDWLLKRQGAIETARPKTSRRGALYDVTSSYYEGKTCPLARFGYDRDGRPVADHRLWRATDATARSPCSLPAHRDPKTVPDQVEGSRSGSACRE